MVVVASSDVVFADSVDVVETVDTEGKTDGSVAVFAFSLRGVAFEELSSSQTAMIFLCELCVCVCEN